MTKPVILFIAHAPSANTERLRDGVAAAINTETAVELMTLSPFDCTSAEALAADGIIIATTENIGAMAGATKDFFDRSYNDLLDVSAGKPVAAYIRAGLDGTGTTRGLDSIFTGLRWRQAHPITVLKGDWDDAFIAQAREVGLTLAAGVELGLY
jgi:multimeric flavodoxin WrbA